MNEDQFFAKLRRVGKEPSKAMESHKYQDPANTARLKGERMQGSELHNLCQEWADWCQTRRFIAPKRMANNTLARFQPSRGGQAPDVGMSSDMAWFNMGIHALADMGHEGTECFLAYYWDRRKSIKAAANEMHMSRGTFYYRRDQFASAAYRMGRSLQRAHAQMMMQERPAEDID